MHLLAGSSNPKLAKQLASVTQGTLVDCQISKFSNGEKRVFINNAEQIRGQKVALLQSFSQPVDENIIETLLLIDALERIGVKEIILIIPWLGYSLQDKVFCDGEAMAAKVVANLFNNKLISQIMLIDLHNDSIPGFFLVPTKHLSAKNIFLDYLKENLYLATKEKAVVVSPDFGGLKRARNFAEAVGLPLLNIDKSRDLHTGAVTAHALHGGEVRGKVAIVYDDVVMSGDTVAKVADLLKREGASQVIFLATHGIFCGNAIATIEHSQVDQVITSNSVDSSHVDEHQSSKITHLDLAPWIAKQLF